MNCLPRPKRRLKRGGRHFYWHWGPAPTTPRGQRRFHARDDAHKAHAKAVYQNHKTFLEAPS